MAIINRNLSGVTKEQMDRAGGWRAKDPGNYTFICTQSDYKPTSNGDGMCLHLQFQCVDRGHERFKIRDFLTLEHPNEKVVEIANAKLKTLAIAVGHPKPDFVRDSRELHNKRFTGVIVKEKVDRYGDSDGFQNRVVGYQAVGTSEDAAPNDYSEQEPPPPTDDDHMGEPAF